MRAIASRELAATDVLEAIVDSTAAAVRSHDHVVIAHLFSVLPKIGLDESDVPSELLERLADAAVEGGARIEVDERWSCPSARTVAPFVARGVELLFSTDSHRPGTIARYSHCADVRAAVIGNAVAARAHRSTPGARRPELNMQALEWCLVALALAGGIPPWSAATSSRLAACQRLRFGGGIAPHYPRVAIVVPAWNEGP